MIPRSIWLLRFWVEGRIGYLSGLGDLASLLLLGSSLLLCGTSIHIYNGSCHLSIYLSESTVMMSVEVSRSVPVC
jgi:hypothetical protein